MNIVMLITQTGSRTGILAESFLAGKQYDLTGTAGERDLAAVFVREGWAREVDAAGQAAPAAAPAQSDGAPTAESAQQPDPDAQDAAPAAAGGVRRKRAAAQ